jgi:hypothetical protein
MPETRLRLLVSSFLLPLACVGQSLPADKDWSADLAMYMRAPGMSGNTTAHGMNVFRRHLAQPAVRRDGYPTVHYPNWAVSADVLYMRPGAANNGFDLGFDQWMVEPVVQYQVTPWLSPYSGARYISVEADIF